jgi:rRNA-processing protein EBP2
VFFLSGRNKMKDDKFGFGGKKRGMKRNDKSSADDISGFRQPRKQGGKFAAKSGKPGMKRPGKSKRQKSKGGKKH